MKFTVIDKMEPAKITCKTIYVEISLWISVIPVKCNIGNFDQ